MSRHPFAGTGPCPALGAGSAPRGCRARGTGRPGLLALTLAAPERPASLPQRSPFPGKGRGVSFGAGLRCWQLPFHGLQCQRREVCRPRALWGLPVDPEAGWVAWMEEGVRGVRSSRCKRACGQATGQRVWTQGRHWSRGGHSQAGASTPSCTAKSGVCALAPAATRGPTFAVWRLC